MSIHKRLLLSINNLNRNTLIIGPGGCGKSRIIQELYTTRKDIILLAPTGVASRNINGKTIHSFFRISPYDFCNGKIENYFKKSLMIEQIGR